MRERSYKLDPNKVDDLEIAAIMAMCDITRQSAYMWLKGKQGISESNFKLLMHGTGKSPAELLEKESLTFFITT